jgi:chromosome partitioning protein
LVLVTLSILSTCVRDVCQVVRDNQKQSGNKKDYVVLLTCTSPSIRSRSLAHIQKNLVNAGVPVLQAELNERDAFKAIFWFDQTLDQLDPVEVPNIDKAKLNVMEFAEEVVARLMAAKGKREEDVSSDRDAGAEMGSAA